MNGNFTTRNLLATILGFPRVMDWPSRQREMLRRKRLRRQHERELLELADLDARMLADIGITPDAIRDELRRLNGGAADHVPPRRNRR